MPAPRGSGRSSGRTLGSPRLSTSRSATKPSSAFARSSRSDSGCSPRSTRRLAGPLATILPRLSTGEPGWVAPLRLALVKAGRNLGAGFERIVRALPIVADALRAIARCGFRNVFLGAQRITASLDRYPLVRWFNWITRNRLPPARSMYSSVGLDNCADPVPIVPGDRDPVGSRSGTSDVQGGCGHPEPAHGDHGGARGTGSIASEP